MAVNGVAGFNATPAMLTAFCMHRNQIGSAVYQLINITDWLINHQMNIKYFIGTFSNGADYRHSKRNAWHKASIHYIDMNVLRPGFIYRLNLFS